MRKMLLLLEGMSAKYVKIWKATGTLVSLWQIISCCRLTSLNPCSSYFIEWAPLSPESICYFWNNVVSVGKMFLWKICGSFPLSSQSGLWTQEFGFPDDDTKPQECPIVMGPGSSVGLGRETDMEMLHKVIPGVLGKPVTVSEDRDDKQDALRGSHQRQSITWNPWLQHLPG